METIIPRPERPPNPLEDAYQASRDALQERLDVALAEIKQYKSGYEYETVTNKRLYEISQLCNRLVVWFAALISASILAFWLDSNSLGFGFLWMTLSVLQIFAYAYWTKIEVNRLFNPFVLPYTSMITLIASIFCFAIAIYQMFET